MIRERLLRLVIVSILAVGAIALIAPTPVPAAPVAPLRVVNHATKECATIMGGDECMECFPPEGWEILDTRAGEECPDDYAQISGLGEECIPFKDRFCCSEGHSGVHGDCEDLVLNKWLRKCAFVDDIHTAALPRGWSQKPDDLYHYQWFCPSGYEWVAGLDADPTAEPTSTTEVVSSPIPTREPSPTLKLEPTPEPVLDPTAEVVPEEARPESKSLPCPGAALVGAAALCVSLINKSRP